MATFTNQTKHKLSWQAPVVDNVVTNQYELNIGDGFNLNIGNGFTLSVSGGGRAGTSWNTTNKTR